MALGNLIPWSRGRHLEPARREEAPVWTLQREINRMFDDFFRGFELGPWHGAAGEPFAGFTPRVDVSETDSEVRVIAEVPGLEEKDFDLSLHGDALVLKGEKREEHEAGGRGESTFRSERSYGAFQRIVPLPCEVEADKASATYRHGVLTVRLPKAASARERTRQISVKSE